MSDVCAVVLSAGEGIRLRPLTATVPKALCPVGNIALLDRALTRLDRHGLAGPERVAVNACHLAEQIAIHVAGRVYLSCEPGPPALGTSGALYHLRDWIAGRPVLAINADAYLAPATDLARDLGRLLDDWDGQTVRVLTVPAGERPSEFPGPGAGQHGLRISREREERGTSPAIASNRGTEGTGGAGTNESGPSRFAGASLLPAELVAALPPGRGELVRSAWRPAEQAGRLVTIPYAGAYIDTGTPADYLAANLHAARLDLSGSGSIVAPDAVVTGRVASSVVGPGAVVAGSITRCVVLPGARVARDENLVDAIRLGAEVTMSI